MRFADHIIEQGMIIKFLINHFKTVFYGEQERLFLWIPILFAAGIGFYFALQKEPSLSFLVILSLLPGVFAFLVRRKNHLLGVMLAAVFSFNTGLLCAKVRVVMLDTPMLEAPLRPREITGRVAGVRHYESGRLSLTLEDVEGRGVSKLKRVKIRVHKYEQLPLPGDRVTLRAGLVPPSSPSVPGDFDYARHAWFQGISAVGYGVSELKIIKRDRGFQADINQARLKIAERIREKLKGTPDKAALAAALITGVRDGMSDKLASAMRDAGLAHLLAISGLHMGLLCGALFFFSRLLLSRSEYLALHYPIKKWAAVIALMGGFAYLLLSGASVPTVRAFIMAFIIFLGILVDRKAISLRLVAIAALVILTLSPEVLLSVSFQMSFAAVVALVAVYEKIGHQWPGRDARFSRRVLYYVGGILLTSLIAEAAIAPFALFHFNRIVHLGLLANLIAMPVMAFWVMPWVGLSLLLMPFHLEELALVPLSWGLGIIIDTATWVSSIPGAIRLLPAIDMTTLLLIVTGALWLGIWRTGWRKLGIPVIVAGIISGVMTPKPDVLIDGKASLIGIKTKEGRIELSRLTASRTVRAKWAQRFGQEKAARWLEKGEWLNCDGLSCLYRPGNGPMLVALVQDERALQEDCARADVVISLVPLEIPCAATLTLDKWDFYNKGGHALWLPKEKGAEIKVMSVADFRGERPWVIP